MHLTFTGQEALKALSHDVFCFPNPRCESVVSNRNLASSPMNSTSIEHGQGFEGNEIRAKEEHLHLSIVDMPWACTTAR
jgi:hypothetical protein